MGVVFFLFLWPVVLAVGAFVLILPFIPYIILAHGIFWLTIGLVARYIFNKHQLFTKGASSKKTWVRVVTESATIKDKDTIVFRFKDGTEINGEN